MQRQSSFQQDALTIRRTWREVGCFLCGALVTSVVWAAWWPKFTKQQPSVDSDPHRPISTVVQTLITPDTDSNLAERLRRLARRQRKDAAANWKFVWTEFQKPEGSRALARQRLLQLDSQSLGQLAAIVEKEPFSYRQFELLQQVFERWGEVDPPAALDLARTLGPLARQSAAQFVFQGFLRTDPVKACAFLVNPSTSGGANPLRDFGLSDKLTSYVSDAVGQWSMQDPHGAADFYVGLPHSMASGWAAESIASQWATQDPAAALDWAEHLQGEAKIRGINGAVKSWAQQDRAGALDYFNGLAADPVRASSLADSIGCTWAQHDPVAASQWVDGLVGEVQQAARNAVTRVWMRGDPATFAVWASNLPDDPTRDQAWSNLAAYWTNTDPVATARWLEALPAGSARDKAVAAYCAYGFTDGTTLPRLYDRLQGIGDAGMRDNVTAELLARWLLDQPQAARQWMSQTNLPAAVVARVDKAAGP